jgi:hypothetical protein
MNLGERGFRDCGYVRWWILLKDFAVIIPILNQSTYNNNKIMAASAHPLTEAAKANNVAEMHRLISAGVDKDAVDGNVCFGIAYLIMLARVNCNSFVVLHTIFREILRSIGLLAEMRRLL